MKKKENRKGAGRKVATEDVIELDFKADIVAAAEALRRSPQTKVILVLPKEPAEFRKLANLKLLARIGAVLNRQAVLATDDRLVVRLAAGLKLETRPRPAAPAESDSSSGVFQPGPPAYRSAPPRRDAVVERGRGQIRRFLIGLTAFLAIAGGGLAAVYYLWPQQAVITVKTHVTPLRANVEAELSQTASGVDLDRQILPLRMISWDVKLQQEVAASGRTAGVKASGIVDVYNCDVQGDLIIDADTVFRKDNRDFVLRADDFQVVIPPSANPNDCEDPNLIGNRRSLSIEATEVGEEYNLEPGAWQLTGLSSDDYSVTGGNMAGGTAAAACVTEEDLVAAEEELEGQRNDADVRAELIKSLAAEHALIPLEGTFQVALGELFEPAVCEEADDRPLSRTVIYYLGGIRIEDAAKLVAPELKQAAGELTVIDNGLQSASYEAHVRLGSERVEPTVQRPADLDYYAIIEVNEAAAGVILDEEDILEQITSAKANQVAARLRGLDGVTSVKVDLSPAWAFWVDSLPADREDIIIEIDNQERGSSAMAEASFLPADGQLLALDVGAKRIGVARANTRARLVEPLQIVKADGSEFDRLSELFASYEPAALIIGLPFDAEGEEGRQAGTVKQWVKIMIEATGFTGAVIYQDETLSSRAAKDLVVSGPVDDLAAAVILEDYLDRQE